MDIDIIGQGVFKAPASVAVLKRGFIVGGDIALFDAIGILEDHH